MPTLALTPLALLDDPECLPVDCAFDAQTLHDVLRGLVLSRRESVTRQVASMRCMSGELHESERSMRAADARARAAEARAKEAIARAAIERRLLSQELASSELRVVRLAYRLEQEAASAQQYRQAAAQHQQAAAQHQQAAAQHLATSMRAVAMLQEREKQPPPPPDGEVRARLLMQLELEAQRRAAAEESSRVLASALADCALSTKPSATAATDAAAAVPRPSRATVNEAAIATQTAKPTLTAADVAAEVTSAQAQHRPLAHAVASIDSIDSASVGAAVAQHSPCPPTASSADASSAATIKPQRPPSPQSLFDATNDGAASTTAGSTASSVAASSIAGTAATAVPNVDELRWPASNSMPARMPASMPATFHSMPARMPACLPATFLQIRELQKLTGRNLMDCKQALIENNGDLEAAVNALAISTRDAAAVASEGAPFSGNSAGGGPAAPAAEPDDAVAGTGVCDQYRIDLAAPSFGQCLCGFPRSAHGVTIQKKPGALGSLALSQLVHGCSATSAAAPERAAAASGRAAVASGTAAAALGRAAASIERAAAAPERAAAASGRAAVASGTAAAALGRAAASIERAAAAPERAAAAPERAAVAPGKVAAGTSPAYRDRREARGVLHSSPPPRPPVATPNPLITTPNPLITTPNQLITTPNPLITTPNPLITTPNPLITTPNPPMHALEPAAGQPVAPPADQDLPPPVRVPSRVGGPERKSIVMSAMPDVVMPVAAASPPRAVRAVGAAEPAARTRVEAAPPARTPLAATPPALTPVAVLAPVFTPGSTSPPARIPLVAVNVNGMAAVGDAGAELPGMADPSTVDVLAYPFTDIAAASAQLPATQPTIAPPVEVEAARAHDGAVGAPEGAARVEVEAARARAFQARVRTLFTEKVGEGSDANGAAVAALRQAQAEYLMPHDATAAAMAYTPARPRRPPAPPAPARDELSCTGGGSSLDIDARGSTAVSLLQRNVRHLSAARVEVATRRELRLRHLEASLSQTSPARPASAASFRDDEGSSGRASISPTSSPSDML